METVLSKRSGTIIAVVVAFLVIAGGITFFMSRQDSQSQAANDLFFQAQQALDKETAAAVTKFAPPPAPAKETKKGEKAPATPPASPEAIEFKKMDVDAVFPQSVKALEAVTQAFPGSRAAFESRMSLASMYFNHGQAEKAAAWYEKAVGTAPSGLDRANALSGLGYSLENSGKPAEAADAYQKAINLGQAALKGDLLLSMARSYESAKDAAKAKSTYDKILSEMPNSEAAKVAAARKAQIQ